MDCSDLALEALDALEHRALKSGALRLELHPGRICIDRGLQFLVGERVLGLEAAEVLPPAPGRDHEKRQERQGHPPIAEEPFAGGEREAHYSSP